MFWNPIRPHLGRRSNNPYNPRRSKPQLEALEERLVPAFFVGTNSENRPVEFEVRHVAGVPTFNRFITVTATTADGLLPDSPDHRLHLLTNALSEIPVVNNQFGNFTRGPGSFVPGVGEAQNHVFGQGTVSPDGTQITLPYRIERLNGSFEVVETFDETLTAQLAGTTDLSIIDAQGTPLVVGNNGNVTIRVQPDSRFDFRFRSELAEEIAGETLSNFPTISYQAQIETSGESGWSLNDSQTGTINGSASIVTSFDVNNFFNDFNMTLFTADTLQNGDTFTVTLTTRRAANEVFGLANQEIASLTINFIVGDPPLADAQVRSGTSEAFQGDGEFEVSPTESQTATQILPQAMSGKYQIRVVNTSDTARSFFVRRQEDLTPGFNVRYRFAGVDITGLFIAGGFTTPNLQPGASAIIEAEITPNANTPNDTEKEVTFKVFPNSTSSEVFDAVAIEAIAGLIVTTKVDSEDQIANDGVLDSDPEAEGQQISLRDAIKISNQLLGVQSISFNILDLPVITLTQPLPTITDKIIIDGTTQVVTRFVILDGSGITPSASPTDFEHGLTLTTGGTIRGMVIQKFPDDGINVTIPGNLAARRAEEVIIDGNTLADNGTGLGLNDANYRIVNNMIGTNTTGTAASGNNIGIALRLFVTPNNTAATQTTPSIVIGEEGSGNVISGNTQVGILINGEAFNPDNRFNARSNFVQIVGNKIGTDVTGETSLGGHAIAGIFINESQVRIRKNVVSGNTGDGIVISSLLPFTTGGLFANGVRDVFVEENLIGLTADGISELGNQVGVKVAPGLASINNIRIGGLPLDGSTPGNEIAFNRENGITAGISDILIADNDIFRNEENGIELNAVPTTSINGETLPNREIGIVQDNFIGVRGGNGNAGIVVEGDLEQDAMFLIGGLNQTLPLSFGELGLLFQGTGNLIENNRIGILAGTQAIVLGNSIKGNDTVGIGTLAEFDGNFPAPPVIQEALQLGDTVRLTGGIIFPFDIPDTNFRLLLQFYGTSEAALALGHGEKFLTERVIALSPLAQGEVKEFVLEIPAMPAEFPFLTMTASLIRSTGGNFGYTTPFSFPVLPGEDEDTDEDGVGDALESQLQSQLGLPNNNGLPFALDPAAVIVPSTRANGQLSLEQAIALVETNQRPLKNVKSVPISTTADVEAITTTVLVPETVSLGFGMAFEVVLEQPGAAAEVKFLLPNDFLLKRIVKMLPDGSFVDITNDLNVTIDAGIVTLTVIDGGPFDGDLLINGRVKDPILFVDVNETDLALSLSSPALVMPTANAAFTLQITNVGPALAVLPTVTSDPLPADIAFVAASDGGVFDPNTRRVIWSLDGTLAPGEVKPFSLVVRPTTEGPLSLSAEMRHNLFLIDTVTSNDTATTNAVVVPLRRITLVQSGGGLTITGDANPNDLSLELNAGMVRVSSVNSVLNDADQPLVFTGVTNLIANLGSGDDGVAITGILGAASTVSLDGGPGADSLISTSSGNQTLTNAKLIAQQTMTLAGYESATLNGDANNNRLDAFGFTGRTTLEGGAGDDILIGGASNDIFNGGTGNDTIIQSANVNVTLSNTRITGRGTDTLNGIEQISLVGGAGNNLFTLAGFTGRATVNGAGGTDTIIATHNANMVLSNVLLTTSAGARINLVSVEVARLIGGAGNNVLNATATNRPVTLIGNAGNDQLFGGRGNDILIGGPGNDILRGNAGNDRLAGGPGRNILDGGPGQDGVVIHGTRGNDHIQVQRLAGNVLRVTVNGVVNESRYFGETVFVFAGAGNDRVEMMRSNGQPWRAEFFGQEGNDTLIGGSVADLLVGGDGFDQIYNWPYLLRRRVQ